jgi:hypothetical protein
MFIDILLLILFLGLIAMLCLILVALIVARKFKEHYDKIFSEDVSLLHNKVERLRIKFPNDSDNQLLERLIKSESMNAGIIGFLTGLGGLVTLPITLPIDIIATIRIQYRLVEYIIHKDKNVDSSIDTEPVKSFALLFGANKITDAGGKFAIVLITQYAPQVLLKSIPLLGGIVGFLIDYMGTRGVAKYALRKVGY